tara:strand:+ start:411 stop:1106 length:696 start_codon:yes stop_codon:yes gene_type:complete
MKPGRGPMMKTGQGIPQTFQSPEKQAGALLQKKQDPKDGDKLPSYTVKGTESVNVPGKTTGKKTTSNYDAAVKSEGTTIVDPKKITKKMTAAANKKRADAKKKDAVASKTITTPASTKTVDTSETKTIGTQTENQVKKKNTIKVENRQSKAIADKNARLIKKRKDSGDAANRVLDRRSKGGRKLTAADLTKAQLAGDYAAFSGDPLRKVNNASTRKQVRDEVKAISARPKG